jgi:hypothetical protein
VCKEFVPTGRTVNSRFYRDILWWPCENVQRHHPKLWQEQICLLHHYNALSHTSILIQQFLTKQKLAVIPHPPYSTDLATYDFFLFPKMIQSWKNNSLIPLRRSRLNRTECCTL